MATRFRNRPLHRLALLTLGVASLLAGCKAKNTGVAGSTPNPASTESAVRSDASSTDLYAAGRFNEAKAKAADEASVARVADREEAALTAGLSAYAINQDDEARRWLSPLTVSRNREVRGKAGATLGLISQRRNEHTRAAELLTRASTDLDGDDSARASLQAGHSLTALGRHIEASQQYRRATGSAQSAGLQATVRPYTEPGPFVVQLGVFGSKANADRTASQAAARSRKAGFGSPKVAAVTDSQGRTGYAVRVGVFPSRQAAVEGRTKLGGSGVVVAAAK